MAVTRVVAHITGNVAPNLCNNPCNNGCSPLVRRQRLLDRTGHELRLHRAHAAVRGRLFGTQHPAW